jgi:hypothetical protein
LSLFKHLNWGVLRDPGYPTMTLHPIREHEDVPAESQDLVHALEFGTVWLRPAHIITGWTAVQLDPNGAPSPHPHPQLRNLRTFTLTLPETGAFRPGLNSPRYRVDVRVEVL